MKNILYELRSDKKKTQHQIATYLGIGQSYYNRLEKVDIKTIATETLLKLAEYYEVSVDYILNVKTKNTPKSLGIKIPVLGTIPAGIPIEAIQEIIDYEEVSQEMYKQGELFALQVKGDSMTPKIDNGDVVIVKKQQDFENGNICVIMVNGFDATLKKVKRDEKGIYLISLNTNYKPVFYTKEQVAELPVTILGKVIELRSKFQ